MPVPKNLNSSASGVSGVSGVSGEWAAHGFEPPAREAATSRGK